MRPSIGFILVTHRQPEQILHLCSRLGEMFGDPPIAIHHDFSQDLLEETRFGPNVRFVHPHFKTDWGGFSVVRAQLAALELLYSFANPDWVVLLSAADYPIQTADRILGDLEQTPFEAFVDLRPIRDLGVPFHNGPLGEFPFEKTLYLQCAFNRYVAYPLLSRQWARRLKTPLESWVLKWPWLCRRTTPFTEELRCFGGDAWFTVNRRVAQFFLEDTPLRQRLLKHYEHRASPEESIYHTMLGNTPGFRLAPKNLRYTDWKGGYAHPRTLGREDFQRLLASNDHFARKFAYDQELLHELDELVGQKPKDQVVALEELP